MFKKFFQNTRKPQGFLGRMMAVMMNNGHAQLAEWGFSHLPSFTYQKALDIGCGGGANVSVLLSKAPGAKVWGVDYSPVCVEQSSRTNRAAVAANRCRILQASAAKLPFSQSVFDVVTAFETVYFWPDLAACFRQVYHVLKPNGVFLICNEESDPSDDRWTKLIDGMKIYDMMELKEYLEQAGFSQITVDQQAKKGWICLTGRK